MLRRTRGFTLIELLVVIAIIGILSSVVLASLNTARDKGTDAARKSNLNNIRAQAEIVFDDDGDYAAVCADTNVDRAVDAANGNCYNAAAGWAANAELTTAGTFYCVDFSGDATTTGADTLGAADFDCD